MIKNYLELNKFEEDIFIQFINRNNINKTSFQDMDKQFKSEEFDFGKGVIVKINEQNIIGTASIILKECSGKGIAYVFKLDINESVEDKKSAICEMFFTVGAYFNDTFLKKEVVSDETHFIGKNKYGNINITVKGKVVENEKSSADVIFMLPNNINKQYKVYFNYYQWDVGAIEIKDEKENTLFEGKYRKNDFWLYDNNGEPVIEENIGFFTDTGEEITYDTD